MTYNVFGGTLNIARPLDCSWQCHCIAAISKRSVL